jgi:hypothetical protein
MMFGGIGMKCLDAFNKNSSGISDVISIVLIAGFITSTIAGIMLWGIPYMENQRAHARIESAFYQFSSFDTAIKDCIRQGPGSKRTVGFSIDSGILQMQSDLTHFIVYYSHKLGFDFNVTDFTVSSFTFILEDNSGISDQTDFIFHGVSISNDSNSEQKSKQIFLHSNETITFESIVFDEAVRIDITKETDDIVIGSILFFNVGSIIYETQSTNDMYRVILQNGGIIQTSDTYASMTIEPLFYYHNDVLTMRIIHLQSQQQSSNAIGSYRFSFEFLQNYLVENKIDIQNTLKLYIQGDFSQHWKTFFIEHHDFTAFETQPDILYFSTHNFTLSYSIFNTLWEVNN